MAVASPPPFNLFYFSLRVPSVLFYQSHKEEEEERFNLLLRKKKLFLRKEEDCGNTSSTSSIPSPSSNIVILHGAVTRIRIYEFGRVDFLPPSLLYSSCPANPAFKEGKRGPFKRDSRKIPSKVDWLPTLLPILLLSYMRPNTGKGKWNLGVARRHDSSQLEPICKGRKKVLAGIRVCPARMQKDKPSTETLIFPEVCLDFFCSTSPASGGQGGVWDGEICFNA